jgi:hypothetical protein
MCGDDCSATVLGGSALLWYVCVQQTFNKEATRELDAKEACLGFAFAA